MPQEASRITLEITGVKTQRVQDIGIGEAYKEGVELSNLVKDPLEAFVTLWDSINGKTYPWSSNPWVWAISFRKIK